MTEAGPPSRRADRDRAPCVFCEIVSGARPAHRVLEDTHAIAFLDRRPLFHGHVLLVPRRHVTRLPELPAQRVGAVFRSVQRLARAVPLAMRAEGSFIAINDGVSQSVPHLHVHVVPRRRGDGLRGFFWPRTKYESEARMEEVAAAIRRALGG